MTSRCVTWLEFFIQPSLIDTISLHMHTHIIDNSNVCQYMIHNLPSIKSPLPTGTPLLAWSLENVAASQEHALLAARRIPPDSFAPPTEGCPCPFSFSSFQAIETLFFFLDALGSSSGRSELNKGVKWWQDARLAEMLFRAKRERIFFPQPFWNAEGTHTVLMYK